MFLCLIQYKFVSLRNYSCSFDAIQQAVTSPASFQVRFITLTCLSYWYTAAKESTCPLFLPLPYPPPLVLWSSPFHFSPCFNSSSWSNSHPSFSCRLMGYFFITNELITREGEHRWSAGSRTTCCQRYWESQSPLKS